MCALVQVLIYSLRMFDNHFIICAQAVFRNTMIWVCERADGWDYETVGLLSGQSR